MLQPIESPRQPNLFDIPVQPSAISIQAQTGWVRPYPQMICQELSVLLRVTKFDYDLNYPGFMAYCTIRFGFVLPPDPEAKPMDPQAQSFYYDHHKTKEHFLNEMRIVGDHGHPTRCGAIRTDDELDLSWKVFCIHRAKIQDCWELFSLSCYQRVCHQVD